MMKNSKQKILAAGGVLLFAAVALWDLDLLQQDDVPDSSEQHAETLELGRDASQPSAMTEVLQHKSKRLYGSGPIAKQEDSGIQTKVTTEPEHFKAARSARWRAQSTLQPHAVSFASSCDEQMKSTLNLELLEVARSKLEAEHEFPMSAHVVKWEMAFGLPEPGALIWAQWNGNKPATYSVHIQDATELRKSKETQLSAQTLKVPPVEIAASLAWPQAVQQLQGLKEKFQQQLGDANYRRIVVTQFAPSEAPVDAAESAIKETAGNKPNLMGEFLNDRILALGTSYIDCQSRGLHALDCSCRAK